MREIKFHAWVKTSLRTPNVMIDVSGISWDHNWIESSDKHRYSIIGNTLIQYTGLLDKNGKEIYEGDIVAFRDMQDSSALPERIGVVDFSDASFYIKREMTSHYRWIDYEVEVIGNIYENPELIKELTPAK